MAHPKLTHLPLGPKWNWQIPSHHAVMAHLEQKMAPMDYSLSILITTVCC